MLKKNHCDLACRLGKRFICEDCFQKKTAENFMPEQLPLEREWEKIEGRKKKRKQGGNKKIVISVNKGMNTHPRSDTHSQ